MMAALGTGSFASLNGSGLEQISNLRILFSTICVSAVAKTLLDCVVGYQPLPVIGYHYLWAKEATYTLALNILTAFMFLFCGFA